MKDLKLPTDHHPTLAMFIKSKAVQIVLKQILGSVMMAVMSKRSGASAMTQKQEE